MNGGRRQGGFTMLEMLVASAVLGIGLLGLARLNASYFDATGLSRQRTEAVSMAENKLNELRQNPGLRPAFGVTAQDVEAGDLGDYTLRWTHDAGAGGLATVTVSWPRPGEGVQQISMSTLLGF